MSPLIPSPGMFGYVCRTTRLTTVNNLIYNCTPPLGARAARALCFDDVRAERAPRVCGVHEGLRGTLDVHVPRRPFSSDVPHRLEQPAPPYVPYYVPHGPHEVRRVVLAGRVTRVDPWGAPARGCSAGASSVGRGYTSCPLCPPHVHARPVRRLLERVAPRTLHPQKLSFLKSPL